MEHGNAPDIYLDKSDDADVCGPKHIVTEPPLNIHIHHQFPTKLTMQEIERAMAHEPATFPSNNRQAKDPAPQKYGWRFWMIFAGLALSALLSALEGSIVSTALPTILADLGGGEDYTWVINIYFLTRYAWIITEQQFTDASSTSSAAFQPLYGQFADLWGRRWLMISSVAIFVGASAICGASQSTAMLIAGRGVQGIGAGGINMLVDVIICDLVPLRDRGSKIGLLFALITVMSSLGPLVGGALVQAGAWRWVFYLNIPLGALAIFILVPFLRVSHKRGLSTKDQLLRIDFVGNGILIASTTLIQYVLTYAGSKYSWSNPHIITLLTIGLVLLVLFVLFERSSRLCPHPVIPPRLFANRTSALAFFISFNHSILTIWVTYFFPLYFQSVLASTPTRSGIQLLPLVFVFPAFAAVTGGLVAKTGRYRPAHFAGLSTLTVGVGCCSLLGAGASDASWIVLQMVVAAGLGAVVPALLPAVQAQLGDADAATSTAAWAFVRSVGTIWGVSIPAAVFNNRFQELLGGVGDADARARLQGGGAYENASKAFVESFGEKTRGQVIRVYAESLKRVWQVGVVFAGLSFLAVFMESPVKLRKELETDFGLEVSKKGGSVSNAQGADEEESATSQAT